MKKSRSFKQPNVSPPTVPSKMAGAVDFSQSLSPTERTGRNDSRIKLDMSLLDTSGWSVRDRQRALHSAMEIEYVSTYPCAREWDGKPIKMNDITDDGAVRCCMYAQHNQTKRTHLTRHSNTNAGMPPDQRASDVKHVLVSCRPMVAYCTMNWAV